MDVCKNGIEPTLPGKLKRLFTIMGKLHGITCLGQTVLHKMQNGIGIIDH